jgi:hypothetical protein
LEFFPNVVGDLAAGDLVSDRIDLATHSGHSAVGEYLRSSTDYMTVGHAFRAHTFDVYIDRKLIFEEGGRRVIAGAVDARPSVQWSSRIIPFLGKDGPAALTEQCMLCLFHEYEEGRKMDNSSRIGFSKLDATIPNENWSVTRRHRA